VLRRVAGLTITVRLVLDGAEFDSVRNVLQATFNWPAPPGATPGAFGEMIAQGGFNAPFGRFDGLWGVFHLFQNADDRAIGTKVVTWSESRGRGGSVLQKFNVPAKIEIVEFPGGVDLFNPKFFETLQCPTRAVVPN